MLIFFGFNLLLLLSPSRSWDSEEEDEHYSLSNHPYSEQYFLQAVEFQNIQNLHDYLNPLGSHNCFISIDNYLQLDIRTLQYPIYLRGYDAAQVIKVTSFSTTKMHPVWLPHGFLATNKNISGTTTTNHCKQPKFLQGYFSYNPTNGFCLRVSYLSFSLLSKPWNCQVEIGILPPLDLLDKMQQLQPIFSFHELTYNLQMSNPSSMPPINAVILRERDASQNLGFLLWVGRATDMMYRKNDIAHDIFLVMTVAETNQSKPSHNLFGILGEINSIRTSWICFGCETAEKYRTNVVYSTVGSTKISFEHLRSLESLVSVGFAEIGSRLTWQLEKPYGRIRNSLEYLKTCENVHPKELKFERIYTIKPVRLSMSQAQIWKSILKNFTFNIAEFDTVCDNGQVRDNLMVLDGYPTTFSLRITVQEFIIFVPWVPSQILFNWTMTSLQFVSCGERGIESIAFAELINVYRTWVWVAICGTIVLMSALPSKFSSELTVVNQSFGILKTLLEQGDPFKDTDLATPKMKWFIGPFLFMSIVLSNAYKNNNVYNMIAPRNPLPWEYFQELVEADFEVYGRSNVFFLNYFHTPYTNATNVWQTQYEIEDDSTNSIWIEFLQLDDDLKRQAERFPFKEGDTALYKNVKSKVHLDPSLSEIMKRAMIDFQPKVVNHYSGENNQDKIEYEIRKNEAASLLQRLNKCDKKALFVPSYLSFEYARNLTKLGRNYVYVGKEMITNTSVAYNIHGHLPPYLMKRLSGFEASGIWEWWSRFFQGSIYLENSWRKELLLKVPTMNGNIMIIFFILVSGHVCATICLAFENHSGMHSIVKSIFEKLLSNIFSMMIIVTEFFCSCYTSAEVTQTQVEKIQSICVSTE